MDLDLEADLGVDTVKQAEVFAAVREAYGIARQETLKLRDFPTLQHVVQFVYDFAPEVARATEGAAVPAPPASPPVASPRKETLDAEGLSRATTHSSSAPPRTLLLEVTSWRESSRSSPRRRAIPRTCWRWTSTSRRTSASTP